MNRPTTGNNCQTGERCGTTCIDPREKCRLTPSPLIQGQIEGLKKSLIGQIPGGKEFNTAQAVISDFRRVKESGDRNVQAMYLGAVLLGTSTLAYAKYRSAYQDKFNNSAEVAMRRANGMTTPPPINGKRSVVFAVDSSSSKAGSLAEALSGNEAFQAFHVVPIEQNIHRNQKELDSLSGMNRKIAEAMLPVKQAVLNAKHGQSDAAVELASQMLAYDAAHSKPPTYETKYNEWNNKVTTEVRNDVGINILGHGDGGAVALEALEILKRVPSASGLSSRVNIVGLNTIDAGLTDVSGSKIKTVASRNSPIAFLPMRGKVSMDAPDDGSGVSMVKKKGIQEFIVGHFGGKIEALPQNVAKAEAPGAAVGQSTTPSPVIDPAKTPQAQASNAAIQSQREMEAKQRIAQKKAGQTPTTGTFSQVSGQSSRLEPINPSDVEDTRDMLARNRRIAKFAADLAKPMLEKNKETGFDTPVDFNEKFRRLKEKYPETTPAEAQLSTQVYKAPRIVHELLQSGEMDFISATKLSALAKTPEDRKTLQKFLNEEMETGFDLDFTNPDRVTTLIADFYAYQRRNPGKTDSNQIWLDRADTLKKRIDALSSRGLIA